MQVITVMELTQDERECILQILCTAFADSALYQKIYRTPKELKSSFRLLVDTWLTYGEMHLAIDDGEIVGVALWIEPGKKTPNLLQLAGEALGELFCPQTISNLRHEYFITERSHLRREHYYLYFIASIKPGAGSALMRYAIQNFEGSCMYLENYEVHENANFYRKFDFHRIGTIHAFGTPIDLLVRRSFVSG